MNGHLPAGPGRAGALGLDPGVARGQGPGRADRVEAAPGRAPLGGGRESDRLLVRDSTRDAVRKALEAAGIVFLSSGRGEGVMLVRQETKKPDEEALTPVDNSGGGGRLDRNGELSA